ncbi:Transcription factor [Macleaya cordata]|uniref:Transcription factor n=1 Tax=Macleaya cordata TaxID=56857 RepID=A0A200QVS8_MACCD|nr:Transcription factor [Macleaya cordata]
MLKTLERYQKCSYSAVEASTSDKELQNSYQEYLRLKARVELLQRSQRNLLREELGSLSTKELEQLEQQLESSLRQIRSTKTQFMLDQLSDLQRKEQMLQDANKALRRKVEENNAEKTLRLSWEAGGQNMPYSRQSEGFFQPLDCNSTLQIGYNSVGTDQINIANTSQNVNGFIPGWML